MGSAIFPSSRGLSSTRMRAERSAVWNEREVVTAWFWCHNTVIE